MARKKTEKGPILVPFAGGPTPDLETYTGYIADEAGPSETKMFWDVSANRRAWNYWSEPPSKTTRKSNYGMNRSTGRWELTYTEGPNERYESQLADYNAWKARVEAGEIVEVPTYVWKENFEFEATLEVYGITRGRSAARFRLRNTEAPFERYEMFMTCVEDLLVNGEVSKGRITGRWTFCKRGSNYSLKPVFADPKTLEEVSEETQDGQ